MKRDDRPRRPSFNAAFPWVALAFLGLLALPLPAAAGVYFSQGSLAPNLTGSWNSNPNGTGNPPGGFAAGDTFRVQNNHSMTTSAPWTVSGPGAMIQVQTGTLTANDPVVVPNFEVDDEGFYVHNFAAPGGGDGLTSDFPGSASITLTLTSTVRITNWATPASTNPAPLPRVDYGHLTINVPTWAGSLNMGLPAGSTLLVNGDLTLTSTGGGTNEFRISDADSVTLDVERTLKINGGRFDFTNSSDPAQQHTVIIGGSLSFTSGAWDLNAGTLAVNFSGGFFAATATQSGTFVGSTLDHINWSLAAGKLLQLGNNFTVGNGASFTINPGGAMVASNNLTGFTINNNGTFTVNGTFQLNQGSQVIGNNFIYGPNTTLVINGTTSYPVSATQPFWPAANSPFNVNVQGAGGISMDPGAGRTVAGLFQTRGPVTGASQLTCAGTARLNAGGSMDSSPLYTTGSILIYATGMSVGPEWGPGTAVGVGVPQNVTLLAASGTVSPPASDRTVPGNLSLNSGALTLNPLGGRLYVGGNWSRSGATFTPNGQNVVFNGIGMQTVTPGGQAFDSLTVDKGSWSLIASGDVVVNRTLTLNSGPLVLGANTLTLSNPIQGTPANLNASATSSLNIQGSAAGISIPSVVSSLNNLTLNNPSGASLLGDLSVGGTLSLVSGPLSTGANTVTLSGAGAVTRASGFVAGNLRKHFDAVHTSRSFEIGSGSSYAPVSVAFGAVSAEGDLTASTSPGDHPSLAGSGLDPNRSVNRYYTLANSGTAFDSASATFNFAPGDVDSGAATGNFAVGKYDAPSWTRPAVGTRTAGSTEARGITSFSDFALGELLTLTISASAGAHGSISPSGAVAVIYGTSRAFTVTPDTGYHVVDVLVDNVSVGPVGSYTFTNVTANHSIAASFAKNTYTLTSSAGPNGSIAPLGSTLASYGDTVVYTITPAATYHVADVLVDSVSVGAVTSYSFNGVTAGHTITASFAINRHVILASAGPNGSISPSGADTLNEGTGATFTLTPLAGYHVADVLVDSASVGAVASYTFTNVTADHTIHGSFALNTVNVVRPELPPSTWISSANPCAAVPFVVRRSDSIGLRGFSVNFQLSPELLLCADSDSVTEGTYLSAVGGTTSFHCIANGGGSYTADGVILGTPCGAADTEGTLFTVSVRKTPGGPNGTGTLTVTSVTLRDCLNHHVPGQPGVAASILIDTVPPAMADFAATQIRSGNDADGTTKVRVTFSRPIDTATMEIYRAPFGGYPQYDHGPSPGSVPAIPSYPPPSPWVLTGITASGQTDEVSTRDFWYYVAFLKDSVGNVGPSNRTSGTLNYRLGDVHDGAHGCSGDNAVTTPDISFLGAHYGITLTPGDSLACLDVGPTSDSTVSGRPLVDGHVNFEDLMMFTLNFHQVSKPGEGPVAAGTPSAGANDGLAVSVTEAGDRVQAALGLQGSGRIQGLSARLTWNPTVVEPAGPVTAGEWLTRMQGVALSPAPGAVDVALLGARASGLAGSGTLAAISFRRIGEGDPGIGLQAVMARDGSNHTVAVRGERRAAWKAPLTAFSGAVPNPFRSNATLEFSLSTRCAVDLSIYSVDGRKVRALVSGPREAGSHRIPWDGTDSQGRPLPAGVFYARLMAGGKSFTRALILVK